MFVAPQTHERISDDAADSLRGGTGKTQHKECIGRIGPGCCAGFRCRFPGRQSALTRGIYLGASPVISGVSGFRRRNLVTTNRDLAFEWGRRRRHRVLPWLRRGDWGGRSSPWRPSRSARALGGAIRAASHIASQQVSHAKANAVPGQPPQESAGEAVGEPLHDPGLASPGHTLHLREAGAARCQRGGLGQGRVAASSA